MTDLLRRIIIAELDAAWTGDPSPTKLAAADWLEAHALDLLADLVDWLRLGEVVSIDADDLISVREVCGPGVANTAPEPAHGLAFRRPCCAKCARPVALTMVGTPGHTSEVTFRCDHCSAVEVLTFAGLMRDEDVVGLLSVHRPFREGEPS